MLEFLPAYERKDVTSKQGEQGDDFSSGSRDETGTGTRMSMGLEVVVAVMNGSRVLLNQAQRVAGRAAA
jgi:hypothetical protein